MRRAARFGDAVMLDSMLGRDALQEHVDRYRDYCRQVGRTPKVVVIRRAWIGTPEETAAFGEEVRQDVQRALQWSSAATTPWLEALRRKGGYSIAEVEDRVVVGDSLKVAERLQALAGIVGIDYFILKVRWSRVSAPHLLFEQIRRLGKAVSRFTSSPDQRQDKDQPPEGGLE